MGTVSGAGDYEVGATVTLTASPAPEHRFLHWTKDEVEVSTDATYTFTATENVTLVAHFEAIPKYNISAGANDGTMGTVTGAGEYLEGTTVELTATANPGYIFVEWSDGEKSATRTITVTEEATYTAFFKAIQARAWAYALNMVEDGDNYVFSFNATATADATLHFEYTDGTPAFDHTVGQVTAGPVAPIAIAKSQFAGTKDIRWSVELDGEEINELAELTADVDIYRFYSPQGVVVDNNTDSETFGQIFIAQPMNGGSDGMTNRTKAQKRGIFLFDQTLTSLNPTDNVGVLPSNVSNTEEDGLTRQSLHRIAMNPVTHQLAMAYNVAPGAVWSVAANNVAGEATNLIAGTAITLPNSICFDENGVLYVMDNANTETGGTLYKVVDGTATPIIQSKLWGAVENGMVSDGRGGVWIAQHRYDYDDHSALTHINAAGEIDYQVDKNSPQEIKDLFPKNNGQVSYRGHCAYYAKENILAFGGNKVVTLYQVEYTGANDAPVLSKILSTPTIIGNIDGLAFDYAGDLYVASATTERFYKYVLPTVENICVVPASKVIEVDKPKYTRDVEAGNFGTICLPYASSNYQGAEFYEIAYMELNEDRTPKGIWLNEVAGALEAGKPYIFVATDDVLSVVYEGDEVDAPAEGTAGLTGTFDEIPAENTLLEGNYMIADNKFWLCGAGCWLGENRAYINYTIIHENTTPIAALPGRRRICMGAAGDNQATGLEGLITPNNQAAKIIKNGQFIIIRGSEMYNAQGVRL
jgi:hypothetical protein